MNGSRPGYPSEPSFGEMRDVSDVAEVVNMVRYFVKNLTCLYNISKNDFLSYILMV